MTSAELHELAADRGAGSKGALMSFDTCDFTNSLWTDDEIAAALAAKRDRFIEICALLAECRPDLASRSRDVAAVFDNAMSEIRPQVESLREAWRLAEWVLHCDGSREQLVEALARAFPPGGEVTP